MLTAQSRRPAGAPAVGLIASLAVWYWIDNTPAGLVAFLLLAHPEPTRTDASAQVAPAMRGLASSLALAECGSPLPDIGARLSAHRTGTLLRLDGCDYRLHVPTSGQWTEFAGAGGTVAVVVGLDPLAAHSPRDTVRAYLVSSARAGRLFMGKARVHAPVTEPVARTDGRDGH